MITFNLDNSYLAKKPNYKHNIANFYLDSYFIKNHKNSC